MSGVLARRWSGASAALGVLGPALLVAAPAVAQQPAPPPLPASTGDIAGHRYVKLATREETRDATLRGAGAINAQFGRWFMLAPLDFPVGAADIHAPTPVEAALLGLRAGGPEPDLKAEFDGKSGRVGWREIEDVLAIGWDAGVRTINLEAQAGATSDKPMTNAVAYLYRRIDAPRAERVEALMGSDDGVKVWLNGQELHAVSAVRRLNADEETVTLDLKQGVNHLVVKVSQGERRWAVAFTPRSEIDPALDAALDYRLDQDFPDEASRYYRVVTIPAPPGVVAEVGGLDLWPARAREGAPGDASAPLVRPMLCTRRGDVWLVDDAFALPPREVKWTLFASGLQEPLGLAVRRTEGGSVAAYLAQRAELTRLVDADGDERADAFETVSSAWQITGNYHEYAFGPEFDRAGNAYVTLNLAHTGGETTMGAPVATRGTAVRFAAEKASLAGASGASMTDRMEIIGDGLRSPDGIGMWSDGQMFYTDQQGDYVGTNKLSPLLPGAFHGHQSTLKWRDGYGPDWKARGVPVPPVQQPAIWFPYQKMGQSATDVVLDETGGGFGPFEGQLFVGEQTYAWVNRVYLEKFDTPAGVVYQGACFPFRKGFASGVHRLCFAPDGSLLVGMTDRGWGSTGPKRFGLQRLVWTGVMPFEILSMQAQSDGFLLTFTRDLAENAEREAAWAMTSYTYLYRPDYGSPEVETQTLTVERVERVGPRQVRLVVSPLRTGFVHELAVSNLRCVPDADGTTHPLLNPSAYYTLHHVPAPASGE